MNRAIAASTALIVLALSFIVLSGTAQAGFIDEQAMVGTWTYTSTEYGYSQTYTFNRDGTGTSIYKSGNYTEKADISWKVEDGRLNITHHWEGGTDCSSEYDYEFTSMYRKLDLTYPGSDVTETYDREGNVCCGVIYAPALAAVSLAALVVAKRR